MIMFRDKVWAVVWVRIRLRVEARVRVRSSAVIHVGLSFRVSLTVRV